VAADKQKLFVERNQKMALTDESGNGMVMPVAPMYGGGNGGFGNCFGDSWWVLLLFILLGNGAWGNGFGGGFGGGELYPWMNQSNQINGGFRDQMLSNQLSGIQSSVTGGFSDVQMALCNGFAGVEQGANARQIANMQQGFAAQTAMSQGFNQLGSQFANCCCENRLGLADLKYTVATENCADRTQSLMNTRDIIDSQTRGTQAILDKLCALELDGVKGQLAQAQRENVGLQNQLNMAALRESQTAQNAFIQQGFSNEVDALYNRLNTCPVPTTPVYGRTPIFTCNGNNGCGCGCGA
jgi:hypothetical protein